MRANHSFLIGMTALACCCPTIEAVGSEAPPTNLDVYETIQSQVSTELQSRFITLFNPSIPIDTWQIPYYTDGIPDNITVTLDHSFSGSWLYKINSPNISQIYHDILFKAEWAKVPLRSEQRAQLAAIQSQLFTDNSSTMTTAGYQNYLDRKANFDKILAVYDSTPEENRSSALVSDYENARDDLELLGKKSTYSPLEENYKILNSLGRNELLKQARDKFNASCPEYESIGHCGALKYSHSFFQSIWKKVLINRGDILVHKPNQTDKSSGISSSDPWRGWIDQNKSDTPLGINDNVSAFAFDYIILAVERPWFDSGILESRAWRWTQTLNYGQLSNGTTVSQFEGPAGAMPLIPDAMILIRGSNIGAEISNEVTDKIRQAINAKYRIAWGPIALGSVQLDPEAPYVSAVRDASNVTFPNLQFLGVASNSTPHAPNPDPDFLWQ